MNGPANPARRRLLKRGFLGGALLAVGAGAFLATRSGRRAPPSPEPLRVLDEAEYAVVYALAARMVHPVRGFPSTDEVRVALLVDRTLERLSLADAAELKQLLRLFESALVGFLFGERRRPFTALGPEEQDEVLREWQNSRLVLRRTGYQVLRTLLMGVYYSSPKVWKAIGYEGPPTQFFDPAAKPWRGGQTPRPKEAGEDEAPGPSNGGAP